MKRTCTIGDCEHPHYARGMCRTHYERWRRDGDNMNRGPVNPHAKFDPAPVLARLHAGHTDYRWAHILCISPGTITRWRNGTRTLSLNMAEHVAHRLGTHPATLWPHQW